MSIAPIAIRRSHESRGSRPVLVGGTMRYLLLIYTEESNQPPADDVAMAEMRAYDVFTKDIKARGLFQAGEALTSTSTATTVQIRDGETVITDGPFAETKEALGGFYLIDARDLDEATAIAARIPAAKHGSIEVRPIWEQPSLDAPSTGQAVAAGG
jgi:hypothetical protein